MHEAILNKNVMAPFLFKAISLVLLKSLSKKLIRFMPLRISQW